MIAELQVVPTTQAEWDIWAWHHRADHADIIQAIAQQQNVRLADYQIEPIPFNHFEQWLERNLELHTEMNTQLGLQSSDLGELDYQDKQALAAWIQAHYLEHNSARAALRI